VVEAAGSPVAAVVEAAVVVGDANVTNQSVDGRTFYRNTG
jgi:hypothetical protein